MQAAAQPLTSVSAPQLSCVDILITKPRTKRKLLVFFVRKRELRFLSSKKTETIDGKQNELNENYLRQNEGTQDFCDASQLGSCKAAIYSVNQG